VKPFVLRDMPSAAFVPHEMIEGKMTAARDLPRFLNPDHVMAYIQANQVELAGRRVEWIECTEDQHRIDYAMRVGEAFPATRSRTSRSGH